MEPKSENRICQNCSENFTIDTNDFSYYEKIGVLPPKICVECRAQLRLSFRNERFLYKRACDNCKKDTLSIFSSNKKYMILCNACWWGDTIDRYENGQEYDENMSFFEQYKNVLDTSAKPALIETNNTNSSYLNLAADNKGCYMIIESSNNEDCINCYWIQLSKSLVDSCYTNKVELSYEVNDCYDSHTLKWSKGCHSCLESAFLMDCRNCSNCLGCINLRGQQYNIFNQQYTKEQYEEKLKSFALDTYSGVENFKKQFQDFIKDKPHKFAEVTNTVNSTGNYMVQVKNNKNCFHSYDAEDNAFCVHAWRGARQCMDSNTVGRSAELVYNSINMGMQVSNIISSYHGWGSQFMEYCQNCPNSRNCFGCAGLINASYCILNKQYSKDEYIKLREQIVSRMKEEGTYGDFFPKELSPLGYNESSANDEFPLTKEQALDEGYNWEDTPRGTYGKETVDWANFPDSIQSLNKEFDVTTEVFACKNCDKNYRIIGNEFSFYKRLQIPIPRSCPECRHLSRVRSRGPNKLWPRSCMKEGCGNQFQTPYAPDRPEIIYCEKCYQAEVY